MKYILIALLMCQAMMANARIGLAPASAATYPSNKISFNYPATPLPYNNYKNDVDAAGVGAYVLGAIGAGLMFYPVGVFIAGGQPNWLISLAGVGVVGLAIPLTIISNNHEKESWAATDYKPKQTELKLVANNQGIGLALGF